MVRPTIDYSLYLVTGRELLPEGKVSSFAEQTGERRRKIELTICPASLSTLLLDQNYYESLEESLQGGVTVVQIREKTADTGEFYEVALRSKEICDKVSSTVLPSSLSGLFPPLSAPFH